MNQTEKADSSANSLPRHFWRRVWIGVAVLLVLTPILGWLAIDLAGRHAWKKARVELRAAGIPVALADIEFPPQVADEENFCAIPALEGIAGIVDGKYNEGEPGTKRQRFYDLRPNDGWFPDRSDIVADHDYPLLPETAQGHPIRIDLWARQLAVLDADSKLSTEEAHAFARRQTAARLPAEQARFVLDQLNQWTPLFDELAVGLDRPYARFTPSMPERIAGAGNGGIFLCDIYHLTAVNRFTDALKIRAVAAVHCGDAETSLQSLEILLRLTQASIAEGGMRGLYFAADQIQQAASTISEAFWADQWINDIDTLLLIEDLLQSVDLRAALPAAQKIQFAWQLLKLSALEADRTLTEDPLNIFGEGYGHSRIFRYRVFSLGWYQQNMASYADAMRDKILSAGVLRPSVGELHRHLLSRRTALRSLALPERVNQYWAAQAMLEFLPAYSAICFAEARRRLALIACAMHRYRIQTGNYPDQLDDLAPTYLAKLPTDPANGRPFIYSKNADGKIQLYSVGSNGIDDGGSSDQLVSGSFSLSYPPLHETMQDWPWFFEPASAEPDP